MTIMGDWIDADYTSKKFTDYGWTTTPGNAGIYDALSDGFGLPKGAKDVEQVKNWLRMIGTPEAQDVFNPLERTHCPVNVYAGNGNYDPYLEECNCRLEVPDSRGQPRHGAAASEDWLGAISMRWRYSSSNKMSQPRRPACSKPASRPRSASRAGREGRAVGR